MEAKHSCRWHDLLCLRRQEGWEASFLFPIHERGPSAGTALRFSNGTTLDVDPEIAPDEPFLVFCSAGQLPGDSKDHLFIVLRKANGWGTVVRIRYAGDDKNVCNTDDEPHLSPDHRTLYFSSDLSVPAHFPRSPEKAQLYFRHLDSLGWFSGYANVWSIPISASLNAAEAGIASATK